MNKVLLLSLPSFFNKLKVTCVQILKYYFFYACDTENTRAVKKYSVEQYFLLNK